MKNKKFFKITMDKVKQYQHQVATILLNRSWKKKIIIKNKKVLHLSPLRFELNIKEYEQEIYYMDIDIKSETEQCIYYMDID